MAGRRGSSGSGSVSPSAARVRRGQAYEHDPPILRAQATLQSFDSGTYTATITLTRSPDTTIASVPVSRAIDAALLTAGKALAVMFFDHFNSSDAMVVGVY